MFVSAGLELKLHSASEDGLETHPFHQHPPSLSKIICVSICNDNTYIAVLRENEKPQILCAKDPQNLRLIHTINILSVSVLTFKRNTKKNIALGTSKGDVLIYDTKTRILSTITSKICTCVKDLDFTSDDQQLCGIDGDTIFVYPDINSSNTVLKYKQSSECNLLRCHPFIPNRAAVGCKNGHIGLWDVQRGVELVNMEALVDCPTSGLAMSSCGKFFVVSGRDNVKICGLDLSSGACTYELYLEQEEEVTCVDLSCDDKYLAVGLCDGTLKLYDVKQQMKLIHCSKVHQTGAITTIMFENLCKQEINSNFSSMVRISEQEIKDQLNQHESGDVCFNTALMNRSGEVEREESLERLKKNLLKILKSEIDSVENQLHEHCIKFQKFLDNEFDTIDGIIQKKWNIFNVGDMNQIIRAILPDECRSNCT